MRLLVGPEHPDGIFEAALEFQPKPGWNTYWREPGNSGIPPVIKGGEGFEVTGVDFPAPQKIELSGSHDYGYRWPVLLPMRIKRVAGGTVLSVTVFIGVCEKICVPFQADLAVMLDRADPAASTTADLLRQAKEALPKPSSADFGLISAKATGSVIALDLALPAGDALLIVTGPEGYAFDKVTRLDREGPKAKAEITLPQPVASYDLAGRPWRLTVVSGDRAMETDLPL